MKAVREWLKHFEESEPWLNYPVCYIEYKTGDIPYCLIQYQGE